MASKVIIRDPNTKPRRAMSNAERGELFREFKLGLFALAALAILAVTLVWDRGQGANSQSVADGKTNLTVQLRPTPPNDNTNVNTNANNNNAPKPIGADPTPVGPKPPPPPPPPPPYREYIVQKGDVSLERIAAKTLGDRHKWGAIKDANPGLDPKKMRVGQALRIPNKVGAAGASQLAQTPSGSGLMLSSNGQ